MSYKTMKKISTLFFRTKKRGRQGHLMYTGYMHKHFRSQTVPVV